jgi:hypothetical protein
MVLYSKQQKDQRSQGPIDASLNAISLLETVALMTEMSWVPANCDTKPLKVHRLLRSINSY